MLIYQTQFLSWLFKVKAQGFRGMLEILLASSVFHLFFPKFAHQNTFLRGSTHTRKILETTHTDSCL